jgi:membrane protein YdbS with pleckstrin-like domain
MNEASASRKAPVRLHPNERIVLDLMPSPFWTVGLYIFTLGLWEFWRRRHHFVVTNERVIVVKGVLNRSEQSAPLARVQDVRLQRSLRTGGSVVLSTAGGSTGVESIEFLTRADALAFADAVTPLLGQPSTPP